MDDKPACQLNLAGNLSRLHARSDGNIGERIDGQRSHILPVHKEGLKDPLGVVEAPVGHGHRLHRVLGWDVPGGAGACLGNIAFF